MEKKVVHLKRAYQHIVRRTVKLSQSIPPERVLEGAALVEGGLSLVGVCIGEYETAKWFGAAALGLDGLSIVLARGRAGRLSS